MTDATIGKRVPQLDAGNDSVIDEDSAIRASIINSELAAVMTAHPWLYLLSKDLEANGHKNETAHHHTIKERLRHMLHND
ncbi:MAG: hypothetical protein KGH60_03910 [Candidatus Micrarchaeota archaeon]|nr:hypothetical protein [Candidatus Micrarchaeota archaeon]